MKRTTITLTDELQQAIAVLMREASPLEGALREMIERHGLAEPPRTEAGVVRMLLDIGWRQVNEVSLELGYQEMAEWYNDDPETKAIRRELDRRRTRRLARYEARDREVDA
jgi:hypothetical protein